MQDDRPRNEERPADDASRESPIDSRAEAQNTRTEIHVSASETASGEEEELTTEEVRQGHTGNHVRYILALSFIGAAAALFLIYGMFAD